MNPKKKRYKPAPTPPVDAHNYILVHTREGPYYRKKRTSKPPLNDAVEGNKQRLTAASPAASRIRGVLEPYLRGLDTGRFIANVSARLRKAMKLKGKMDFTYMEDYDFQPYRPIWEILQGHNYQSWDHKGEMMVDIKTGPDTVIQKTKIVSDYFYELILVCGDPSEQGKLNVEHSISPLYSFKLHDAGTVRLTVPLPDKGVSWMAILKVSCLEGNEMAHHARHYGMRVVEVG